ncbi:MAG: GldG family protein [Patescibacteria group bacterium]
MFHSSKIFLFVSIFIIVNLLSNLFFFRLDFTQGKIYTLSSASKQIVNDLPEGVEIKAFISDTLPPQFVSTKTQVVDKLHEYENMAKGKISLTIVDPAKDKTSEEMATSLNIPALDLQVVDKDQMQVIKAYFGLAVLKKGETQNTPTGQTAGVLSGYSNKETLPVIENLENLEYDLGSMLLKVGSVSQKKIGFLTGHGEHTFASSSQFAGNDPRADYKFEKELARNYDIKTIDLSTKEGEDKTNPLDEIDTLIIPGPTEPISDEEAKQIHDFVAKGKNAILLIDRMKQELSYSFSSSRLENDYQNLLSKWGLSIEPKLVADSSNDMASFNQGYVTYSVPYPFFTKVTNINQNNAITSNLESFTIPWANPIKIDKKDGVNTEVLASTSQYYNLISEQEVTAPANTNTEGNADAPAQKTLQPINLGPEQDFGITRQSKDPLPLVVMAQAQNEGKIILVSDSDFLSQSFAGNDLFFYNCLDSLTLGDTLIQIRSKGVTDRPIGPLSEGQKTGLRWGLTLGVPILFILYGFYRRSQRNILKNRPV